MKTLEGTPDDTSTDLDLRARRDVRRRDALAHQHGRACLRRRLPRRHAPRRPEDRRDHRRLPWRAVPDARRHHLAVRAGAEQRHHRLAGPPRGPRREGPPRRDPVDHVPDLGAADLGRRGQPGRGRDHRPDRPRLRLPLPDLAAADGPDGGARRAGRRLLADLDLRRHHQRRRRRGRPAAQPDDDLRVELLRQRRGRAAALHRPRRPQAAAGRLRRDRGRQRAAHRDREAGHRPADLRRQRGRGAEPADRPRSRRRAEPADRGRTGARRRRRRQPLPDRRPSPDWRCSRSSSSPSSSTSASSRSRSASCWRSGRRTRRSGR